MNKVQKATLEKIAIMQAFADGAAIEYGINDGSRWYSDHSPDWRWSVFDYRIKQEPVTYPTVDWSIFTDDMQWIAFDENGDCYAYTDKPKVNNNMWILSAGKVFSTQHIKIGRGTCDWRDSLIQRP